MMDVRDPEQLTVPDPRSPYLDGEMMELSLLLPAEQAEELEEAAHRRGLTVGQMLRRLIVDFLR